MKILLTILLLTLSYSQQRVVYKIEYVNQLNPVQMRILINSMIGQFSPNCKPYSLTVNTTTAYVSFYKPCMGGNELKNISLRTVPDASVKRVSIADSVLWPIQVNTKRK